MQTFSTRLVTVARGSPAELRCLRLRTLHIAGGLDVSLVWGCRPHRRGIAGSRVATWSPAERFYAFV
jgi:hypothetical protein